MWMLEIGTGGNFSCGIKFSRVIIWCSALYDTLLDSLVINKNIFIATDSLMPSRKYTYIVFILLKMAGPSTS